MERDSPGTTRGEGPFTPPTRFLPPRRPRRWLPALLFAGTVVTTVFAGSDLWLDPLSGESPWSRLGPALAYAAWTLAILGSHEMGHYLACRYYRIPATLPYFLPGPPPIGTFGAVIRIRGIVPHRRALFDVAAAGPLAGFAVALPALVLGILRARPVEGPIEGQALVLGPPVLSVLLEGVLLGGAYDALEVGPLYRAGWIGMLVTSLNLFPVGQLDGGHLAYALSRSLHRRLARATLWLMLGVVVLQSVILFLPPYLLWFLILLWMRDRHPFLADETSPLPGSGRRWVALLLLAIFVTCFIPVPLSVAP